MEKSKFLSFYSREINRIRNINTPYKATREQNQEYTFNGERMSITTKEPLDMTGIYSSIESIIPNDEQTPVYDRTLWRHQQQDDSYRQYTDMYQIIEPSFEQPQTTMPRVRHALEKLQSDYITCGADNLDYFDQTRMRKYLNSLTHQIAQYERTPEYCSKEVIEELIVLANLYLGMQIVDYPAFLRLVKKQYIENYILSQGETLEFRIINFDQSFRVLQELETSYRIRTRYEKESNKIAAFVQGINRKYKNNGYNISFEERENNLKNNVLELLNKLKKNGIVTSYIREKIEKHGILIDYVQDILYVIEGNQTYDIAILEMMTEIANILCDMPIRNPYAFKNLQEISYFESNIFVSGNINVLTYDETYKILTLPNKKL